MMNDEWMDEHFYYYLNDFDISSILWGHHQQLNWWFSIRQRQFTLSTEPHYTAFHYYSTTRSMFLYSLLRLLSFFLSCGLLNLNVSYYYNIIMVVVVVIPVEHLFHSEVSTFMFFSATSLLPLLDHICIVAFLHFCIFFFSK